MVPEVNICSLDERIDVGKKIIFRVWTLELGVHVLTPSLTLTK